MTNERSTVAPDGLPAPVTGVARGGHGTGTALEDTQVYDVADFMPVLPAAAGEAASPQPVATPVEPSRMTPVPMETAPAAAAVAAPPAAARTTRAASRATSPTGRLSAPAAGLAGFALAAGLAILIGAVLGGMPMPDGAAAGGESARPTAAPAETEAPDDDDDDERDGNGGNGRGGGNGNDGNGRGNDGNGRGNGNDDDDD